MTTENDNQDIQNAPEQGHAQAQRELGSRYETEQGVPQDETKAADWIGETAEQGEAYAQYELGLIYVLGQGVPMDGEKARELLFKAAAQGHEKAKDFLAKAEAEEAKNRERIQKLKNKIFPCNGHQYYIIGGIPLAYPKRAILLFNNKLNELDYRQNYPLQGYSLWNVEFKDEEDHIHLWPYEGEDSTDLIKQILENFLGL